MAGKTKKFSLFDAILNIICVVFVAEAAAPAAAIGNSQYFWWILLIITFLLPYGMIAAVYASLTLVTVLFLGSLAWGPVQLRISEAVCVLALFTSDAIPGLALGCVIANLANIVISGTGTLGLLDVVFGALATALGA